MKAPNRRSPLNSSIDKEKNKEGDMVMEKTYISLFNTLQGCRLIDPLAGISYRSFMCESTTWIKVFFGSDKGT